MYMREVSDSRPIVAYNSLSELDGWIKDKDVISYHVTLDNDHMI